MEVDDIDFSDPHAHFFYQEMRDLMTGEKEDKGRRPWFFNYAMNHRDRLKYLASHGTEDMAGYAKEVLELLPKEPALKDKIQFRLRRVFNAVYDRLPYKIGPFKFP